MNKPSNDNELVTQRPLGVSIITFLLIISVAHQVFLFYGVGVIDWVLWIYEITLLAGAIGFYMGVQWCWLLVTSLLLASVIISLIDVFTLGIFPPELLIRPIIQVLFLIYMFSLKVQQFFQFHREKKWHRLAVIGAITLIYFALDYFNL